jgi:single-stranded-DNA-specific exonuclease
MTFQHIRVVRRPEHPVPFDFPPDLNPVLAKIYAARNIRNSEELSHALSELDDYRTLRDIEKAVALLQQALTGQWRILVIGDFDADGATSTALAAKALRMMGAENIDFLVPNRFEYGYGLTPEIVAVAIESRPDLIITVDNGISSIRGVQAANDAGIKVLVTDHHLPAERLPAAEAIVNPNQPGDEFPSKSLAGVGVIFYVMLALRAHLRDSGWFNERGEEPPNLARLLDLVALGTVADVVPLERNNRILVAQGLARIRAGECSAGIQALIEVAGRNQQRLVASDLGYAIGPRLNAAGRLTDMALGIHCLLSEDIAEARTLAAELDTLNHQRREIEGDMQQQAQEELERFFNAGEMTYPKGVCLYRPDWHEGVIGILASRIKERLHRPVIVFTDSGDDQMKGSARSVKGLHIRDTLDAVAAHHPGLLTRFGGHAMAAGMTLPRENYEIFRSAFVDEVDRQLSDEDLQAVLTVDDELSAAELDMELAQQLRQGGPWGQGFPEPLFEGKFNVVQSRIVGERHLKLLLGWPEGEGVIDAIAFNADLDNWQENSGKVSLVYRVDVNEYRGERSVQLIIEYMQGL